MSPSTLSPACPALSSSLTYQRASWSPGLVLFCEFAEISLHSPVLVLTKVLNNIGPGIVGLDFILLVTTL